MTFAIILAVIVASLFIAAFVTNRRFGIRGLALATGAMMATLWVGDLTPIIAQAGFVLVKPPLESVVAATLVLLPALLLLLSGPTYTSTISRIAGAALFALLGTVLLLEPIGSAFVIEGAGQQAYAVLTEYRVAIITACLVVAVFDIVFTKTPKLAPKH
jgi:hypothetical protein